MFFYRKINPETGAVTVLNSTIEVSEDGFVAVTEAEFELLRQPAVITLTAVQALAANKRRVDSDVDMIYAQAVGNRSLEYTTAENQAQAFKDAGYTGAVPSFVASWVTASGMTATDAANNILAQATAWRGAVDAIRTNRLMAKKRLDDGVPTAMAQWNGFVAAVRAQLGL